MSPKVWFTADTHFGHKNVIAYCNRPFENTVEMDEELIRRWNATVNAMDIIYHLGDFAFAPQVRIREILARLNGRKILIMGNHDKKTAAWWKEAGFHTVAKPRYGESIPFMHFNRSTEEPDVVFHMSHYPFRESMGEYDQRDYLTERAPARASVPSALVHGHVHQAWKTRPFMVNVGCDVWDLTPVSLETVLHEVNYVRDLPNCAAS